MSHRGQIPSTTRSNPRYASSNNSSFYGSANQSFNKSNLMFNSNQSLNGSIRDNTSILYPNKSKSIPSRNSWSHSFSVPIETGKPGNTEQLYSNPHVVPLKTGNNRRIVCGGLQWDLYIHPNQGENNNEFGLSAFPVKNSINDKIPDNYKLKYTITTSLNPRNSLQIGSENDDDQKSLSQFDNKWTREISDIVYDANISIGNNKNQQINWRSTMERLSFTTNHLLQYNCDQDDCFSLYVSIQTQYIKNNARRSQYVGVLGAILLQSEHHIEEQKKQIEKLNNKQNEHILQLERQLNQSNKINSQLIESQKNLTDLQTKTVETFDTAHKSFETSINDLKQELKYKDQTIESLRRELQHKNEETKGLEIQITKLKAQFTSQLNDEHSFNRLISALQSGNTLQNNQNQQILQQQQLIQQQRIQNQNVPPLVNQNNNNNMAQQPQQPQQQPISNPFMPNASGGAKLSGVNPAQSQQHSYGNFPTGSPSQNVNTQRGSGGTLVISPSSQGGSPSNQSLNQSPQQSYKARMISEPGFDSLQFQQLNITSPNKTQQLTQQRPQQEQYSMTEQPVAAQSPPQIPSNNNNDLNHNFGALSMTQETNDNTLVSNFSIPNLEKPEPKQKQEHENKSQALHNDTSTISQNRNLSQKHESETGAISDPEQLPIVISDVPDPANDDIIFQHRPARAWRWDADQEKYRGRGKGQMTIYFDKVSRSARIIFYDEKNEKTRLLQYINGHDLAHFNQTERNSNNQQTKTSDDEVVWYAADYTMDVHNPMVGQWKMQFNDNPDAAHQFIQSYNQFIQSNNDENQGQDPDQDQDDNKSNDSTKPFAFNIENEQPTDSFTDNNNNNQWSFNNNSNNDNNETSGSGGFGDINWSFDANKTEQKVEDKPVDTPKVNDEEEEDNGSKHTFKPIVQLDEVDVASGHENEDLIKTFNFIKLFRFGKDVTGHPGWKNRASQSQISFYKSKESGKIRMIAREQDTNKLRMNQNVPTPSNSNFQSPKEKMYQWSAYDITIAAEEEQEQAGFSLWLIKFESTEIGQEFKNVFEQASNSNDSMSSPVKSIKQESNEQEPATPQQIEKTEQEIQPQNDNEEDDKYKGWSQQDIMEDKQRQEKAKIDAQQAKLFGGGDNTQQTASWSMNAFDSNNTTNSGGINFKFSEDQRGVDLEAEKELNRIKIDENIQFGVSNDNNNNNSNDQQPNNETQEEPSALGATGFSFVDSDNNGKDQTVNQTSTDGAALSSAWNVDGGGFSSVTGTDNNFSWGTDNNDGGWGNFGDNSNVDFASFGDKNAETNNDDNKENGDQTNDNNNDNNDTLDDDNAKEITFKPIVQLDEVDVASGHEDEKLLNTFEIAKVYRWGKDVTGQPVWKNRASNTKIHFYQSNSSGRIRIVCREDITNKLRLNQGIDKSIIKIDKKTEKQIGWNAVDTTIAAEDESNGFCSFAAKFRDGETATAFMKFLETSADNNEQLK